MKIITLDSENDFTKSFTYEDVKLFMSKAYDEDSDKHYLIASIPEIPEIKAAQINYPMAFESEEDRNKYFINFDTELAKQFIENIIEHIKQQKENA